MHCSVAIAVLSAPLHGDNTGRTERASRGIYSPPPPPQNCLSGHIRDKKQDFGQNHLNVFFTVKMVHETPPPPPPPPAKRVFQGWLRERKYSGKTPHLVPPAPPPPGNWSRTVRQCRLACSPARVWPTHMTHDVWTLKLPSIFIFTFSERRSLKSTTLELIFGH